MNTRPLSPESEEDVSVYGWLSEQSATPNHRKVSLAVTHLNDVPAEIRSLFLEEHTEALASTGINDPELMARVDIHYSLSHLPPELEGPAREAWEPIIRYSELTAADLEKYFAPH